MATAVIQTDKQIPPNGWSSVVATLHALLFAAESPASVTDLAAAMSITQGQVEQAAEILEQRLSEGGGIMLVRIAGGLQLCTRPEFAEPVAGFLKPQRRRLSRALLEVLAIIAYRQPMTIAEIESVRGVQCDYSVRQLVERRFVQEVGRRAGPGRPALYGTTQQFLHQFNLENLSQLPFPHMESLESNSK